MIKDVIDVKGKDYGIYRANVFVNKTITKMQ